MPVFKGKEIPPPPEKCSVCGNDVFSVLLFFEIEPDGYVCVRCGALYSFGEDKPIATVIGGHEHE